MNRLFGVAGVVALGAMMMVNAIDDAAASMLKDDPSRPLPPSGQRAVAEDATGGPAPAAEEAARNAAESDVSGRPYEALIRRHANEAGVPVDLAHAVVRIESNYKAGATGSAGEVGLMQIKPRTAQGIGFTGSAKALYDADTNLRWGMKYLAGAYKRAGGDLCGTVMRYQGGHYASRMTSANSAYCGRAKTIMASASGASS